MLFRAIVLAFALVLAAGTARSADIYVDAAGGSDTHPGMADAPLQTLAAALGKAAGGDTICLQAGRYGAVEPEVGPGKHVFAGKPVTIRPAPGVADSRKRISIQRLKFGVRSGQLTGNGRKGVYDINLRVTGVRILDGVYVYGGRHLEIVDCRIERMPPWTGSAENIEKFAVVFGAGDDLLARECEITDTAGGVVISGSRNRVIGCTIHDIAHDGVRCVSSKDSLVEGNRIFRLDDGVDDGDPRGVGPDGQGWNRHCDAIHIFIPGPGVPGAQNSRLTIRGNVMYDCESQAMQFNNYLRVKDLWNEDILIENNIFGPTRANVVNIADPVDGIVFRNNTIVRFDGGRTFQGRGRSLECRNHTFRITPQCKRARVYNNILCNTFDVATGWFAGYNLITSDAPHGLPTRFDKIVPDAKLVDPDTLDGRLAADSPAVNLGTSRFAEPEIHPTDIHGTPRDARPDCGAVELPGQSPAAEPPAPTFEPPAKIFVDDFADGNTSVDPWLAGKHQQGLAWVAPAGQPPWRIQPAGKRPSLSAIGQQGRSWMLTSAGDGWADVALVVEYSNAYNGQGAGVLLRANPATEGYLVEVVGGRIVRRKKDARGQIIETVLAEGDVPVPRQGPGQCHFTIKDTVAGVQITADAEGNGRPELSAVDAAPDAIAAGRIGVYCNLANPWHRTDVIGIKLTVDRTVPNADAANQAPVCWTAPFPELSKPHAGFPLLEGVEHFDVFRATPQAGVYSHHSQLAHHDGVFYAAWSNQQFGEDGPGQRVLMSLSKDGRGWSEAAECFAPRGPVKPAEEMGRVLTANGWVRVAGAVYCIAEVHDNIGFVSIDGRELGPERTGQLKRRARKGYGRLARRVSPDGQLGPIFWLVDDPPDPLPGLAPLPDARDPQFAELAQEIDAVLDQPLNMPNWDFRGANQTQQVMADVYVKAGDGHSLCEPSTYRRPDGALVRVYRDHHPTHRLYASLSRDGGKNWTVPVPTNIPDSPSRTAVGSLPDGTVFLVGNQLSEPLHRATRPHYTRDPLTLALSADGVTFNRVFAVRSGSPNIRLPGSGKGRGYQYPSAVVVADAIWIMYSVGKEDVAISRVPLASLPRQ